MGSPLPQNKLACICLAKTEPPRLGFWFCSPNEPPLAPDQIAPDQYLNPSVPHPNGVPSTTNQACPHFASQNRAPTARLLVFQPKPASPRASPHHTLSPPHPQCAPPQ